MPRNNKKKVASQADKMNDKHLKVQRKRNLPQKEALKVFTFFIEKFPFKQSALKHIIKNSKCLEKLLHY